MDIIETFDRGASLYPERTCFLLHDGSGRWSYAETASASQRIAAALAERGCGSGSRVAVLSQNHPLAFMCVLGALRIGATWVGINIRSTPGDIAALLKATGCDALFYAGALAEAADAVQQEVDIPTLVSIGPGRPRDPDLGDWMAPEGAIVELPPHDPERVVGLLGTGGTTGRPKIVQVPNRAFLTMTLGFAIHLHEPEPPVQLVAAPMTHAAGALSFVVMALGGTLVVHPGVVPAEILSSIERHRVTQLFLPPTAIYPLLADPGVRDHDYSSLRHFIYGAAPMSVEKLREAIDVFGPVMCQIFGQSEVPMICTYLSPEEHLEALRDHPERLASCGRQTLVAHVEIAGADGGLLSAGERGEIVVRSDLRMRGYLADPEQTAGVDYHGWHATGDIGYKDRDGYLFVVDRKRDMIITGGFNVFPSEVEQVIWAHPAVRDCAVIGVPDETWGEAVTAVVELKDGATVGPDELIAMCRERLGGVKTPKRVIFRSLPRSPVGKVLKRALRDEFWAGRARAV